MADVSKSKQQIPAERPTAREEEILAAACRAMARLGFGETRISDVAREAGTSTGTVHYYFETKDDVLVAALKWANDEAYRRLDQELERADGATAKLRHFIEVALPYSVDARNEWLLWLEFWTRALRRPDLAEASAHVSERWRRYFFDIVSEGVAAGEFRPVAPAEEVAERLVALVDGLGLAAVARSIEADTFRGLVYRFAAEQLGVPLQPLETDGGLAPASQSGA